MYTGQIIIANYNGRRRWPQKRVCPRHTGTGEIIITNYCQLTVAGPAFRQDPSQKPRPRVKSGCADVATGKMQIKSVDVNWRCAGKTRMCGCDFTLNLSTLHPPHSRPTLPPTAAPCHGLITSNYPALSVMRWDLETQRDLHQAPRHTLLI